MSRLTRLFQPKHIAVFGGAWAGNVIAQLQKSGFAGEIWPVHPKKQEIAGLQAYQDVASLPAAPDASFIGVNRNLTPAILGALSEAGAGGAVCFASGFAETQADDEAVTQAGEASGADLQEQALAQAGDMPFLGPNCYGFVNYLDNVALWPDEHGGVAVERGVAIITQSSNMAITLSMSKRALPLAMLATAGNQAQLDMCDIGQALIEDERVTALGLHIEGIADKYKFEALAALARQKQIPIVALKVGKSEAAQQATLSHTASLAGSDESAEALFARLGIARLHSLGAFVEALKLAHICGALPSFDIASLSCSGGEASLVADVAHHTDLRFPPLTSDQQAKLSEALGPLVHLSNPLDYQTYIWGDNVAMTNTFAAMLDGAQAISCLVLDPPRIDRCDDAPWQPARDCLIEAVRQTSGKAVMISTLSETLTEAFCAPAIEAGIAPLMGLEDGLAAIEAMAKIGAHWQAAEPAPLWQDMVPDAHAKQVMVSEDEAKKELAEQGIDVPRRITAHNSADAIKKVQEAGVTPPFVVKGMGFAHKTESDAVRLNIQDHEALSQVIDGMAAPEGYLIEEMVTGTIAELLIGIVQDPAHGPLLTVADGGIYTELLQDKVTMSLPISNIACEAYLRKLRCWPKLAGYRGREGIALPALLDVIQKLSAYYQAAAGNITEIEMNPVICTYDRVIAVDALIARKDA